MNIKYVIYKGIKLFNKNIKRDFPIFYSTYGHKNLRHWNHCPPDICYNHLCHRIFSSCQCNYQFYIRILYSLEMKKVRNMRDEMYFMQHLIIRNSTFYTKILPGQGFVLQYSSSLDFPVHVPPNFWETDIVLVRLRLPVPQGSEHEP